MSSMGATSISILK
jgi:hypothetical protein